MRDSIDEIAYAKINLALHVRRRRADGYHELDTIFAFACDGDLLRVEPADDLSLIIEGPFAGDLVADADNLVLRAAHALQAAFGVGQGAALTLDKRLPVAAGIGGGSADAAATIRLLATLWGIDVADARVSRIAGSLGADVPACLASVTARAQGVGWPACPVADDLAGLPMLLVNPRLPLATGTVFRSWDGVDRGALASGDAMSAARAGRNDLEPPACKVLPAIRDVLARLADQSGTRLVRMSGSGATCFALFESEAARDLAAEAMDDDWWCLATALR